MSNKRKLSAEFDPSILHPLYLIRSRLLASLLKHIPQLQGKVLDFGCGIKPYEPLFQVEKYVGVDYVGEGETYSKEKVDFIYDGRHLPFPDASFDGVFSTEVMEHIFNPDEILPELNRVLKPGGRLLITCPFTMPEHEVPNDFARYTSFAIRHLLEKHGFEILAFEKTGNFVEAVFQLRIIYWDQFLLRYVRKIPVVRSTCRFIVYTGFNLAAKLTSSVFPKGKTLYLSNVILAQKK